VKAIEKKKAGETRAVGEAERRESAGSAISTMLLLDEDEVSLVII
jgi:hypothetical protein